MKRVTFSEGLEKIGAAAFRETALEKVVLPTSLRTIAQESFFLCKSLKTVKLNEGLVLLGTEEYDEDGRPWRGAFEESALESIELPSTLRRIENCAFADCMCLSDIRLPPSLEYIGQWCFSGSGLAEV